MVVPQLVERSLLAPDVCSWNPVIDKLLYQIINWLSNCNCIEKTKREKKEAGNGPFFKITLIVGRLTSWNSVVILYRWKHSFTFMTSGTRQTFTLRRQRGKQTRKAVMPAIIIKNSVKHGLEADQVQQFYSLLLWWQPVWPDKNRQISIKVAQKWYHWKN